MKSAKTFHPEFNALRNVAGVFYQNEQEYEAAVYPRKGLPITRALAFGRDLASIAFKSASGSSIIEDNVYRRLHRLLERYRQQNPRGLNASIDAFAIEHFYNNPERLKFTEGILDSLREQFQHIPDRKLEQTFIRWWIERYGDPKEGAERLIRWLLDPLTAPVESGQSDGAASIDSMSDDDLLKEIERHQKERSSPTVFEPLQEDDVSTFELDEHGYLTTRTGQRFYRAATTSSDELIDCIQEVNGINVEELLHSWQSSGIRLKGPGIPALNAELGTDAFGTYLPFHAFAYSTKTPWGIYIFLEPLLAWTIDVWTTTGKIYPLKEVFTLLFLVTYRHEMFHYHVERQSFLLEVSNRRPHYRPYIESIRAHVSGTEQWLEEALAQAVVFPSTFVRNRTFLNRAQVVNLLHAEFKQFGPGYSHFDCKWTGGVANAHRRLGTQLAHGRDISNPNEWVTDLAIPKIQYTSDFKAVPGYFAFTPTVKSQFQFQTPRSKDIRRFWQRRGGEIDPSRASSHENWKLDGRKVQFVDRDGYADLNSFKALAKALDLSVYDLKQTILHC